MGLRRILLSLSLIALSVTFAQSQNGFVSVGGDNTGVGGSLSHSIGQLVYTSNSSLNGSLLKGVQQPYEVYESTLSVNKYPDISLDLRLYPNPTTSHVILSIGKLPSKYLAYQLYDLNGRLLILEKINTQKTIIPFNKLPIATYFLIITDNSLAIKNFKIIKNN